MSVLQRFIRPLIGLALLAGTGYGTVSQATERPASDTLSVSGKIALQQMFGAREFRSPVALLQSPDNASRWYVVEKAGRVLLVDTNATSPRISTLLDITETVESGPSEAGLLGMALHPDFADNGRLFLSYTKRGSFFGPKLVSCISGMTLRGETGAKANAMETLLTLDQPYSNHNGGHIAFGPDGYLYIGFGDGGSAGDPQGHAQNTATLLGAILRIDVDGARPYRIPPDNPLVGAEGKGEIFAWGLRNPWRFSFDRLSGALWAADVGQNRWEEIDRVEKGKNYGWSIREGLSCYREPGCDRADLADPVAVYGHDRGCSVTGGYVYRGRALKELQGIYLFGDYCSGRVWGIPADAKKPAEPVLLLESGLSISSFAEGSDGELYILDYSKGGIYKIVAAKKE